MNAPGVSTPVSRRTELASLAERISALQAVRLSALAIVLLAVAFAPDVATDRRATLITICATYTAVQVGGELVRRLATLGGHRLLPLVGAMVLVDAVWIATVAYRTGGATSYLSFLVEVHVIAVILLVSYRTGLKLALWYTLLFALGHFLQRAGWFPDASGRHGTGGLEQTEVFSVLALWMVTVVTAALSSLNERELRRSKFEIGALAAMSAGLTEDLRPERVPEVLLECVLPTFGMRRGVVLITKPEGVTSATTMDLPERGQPATASSVDRAEPWTDAVATTIADRHDPVLLRSVAACDPLLRELLPDARNVIIVPLVAEGNTLGAVVLEARGWPLRAVPARTVAGIAQFAAHAALALQTASLHEEVRRLATTDALTGLANRRTLEEALDREVARAARLDHPLALAIIDLDHFKKVNDTYGHHIGDVVLRLAGEAVRGVARASDVAARFGGEEFVLLLPDCDEEQAVAAADRIRQAVAENREPVPVTASAGVAVARPPNIDRDRLFLAADAALYRSKDAGRDRTTVGIIAKPRSRRRNGNGKGRPLAARRNGSARAARNAG